MSDVVIKGENLSKQYRLGLVGAGTLREDLIGLWYRMRNKKDPFQQLAEANDQGSLSTSNYVWALQNVNFEVNRGEVLGVIGKNGAGKSTLLKLLSRVTAPTTGVIKAKGRIASLLEVGTGFHPELTGRENVYLNGAIMGMNRAEITRKLDEIVEFAGVQRYLETPVKRYSSGMYVRLAFAVAAHLEPEILIVDEVLAVGDAEFQKKAIGKMEDVSSGQGRTVLFVSHNMKAVNSLCTSAMVLRSGTVEFTGGTEECVSHYLGLDSKDETILTYSGGEGNSAEGVALESAQVVAPEIIKPSTDIKIKCQVSFEESKTFYANIVIRTHEDLHLFSSPCKIIKTDAGQTYDIEYNVPGDLLKEGDYRVCMTFVKDRSVTFHTILNFLTFKVTEVFEEDGIEWYGKTFGLIKPRIESSITALK
ncbi:ABC transporter ATP-binding protein [Flavobacteriales bacterium]|nr:ABC transporter ATP-binding protein [Flavobacteriales bacterium]